MTFGSFLFFAQLVLGLASPPTVGLPGLPADSLAELTGRDGDARVMRAPLGGQVTLITGLRHMSPGESPAAKATAFIKRFSAVLGVSHLEVRETTKSKKQTVVHFDQVHNGLKVVDRSATVTFDHAGFIRAFNNDCGRIDSVQGSRINREEAVRLALASLSQGANESFPLVGEPVVKEALIVGGQTATRLFEVHVSRKPLAEHLVIRVDAHAGQVVGIHNAVIH